MDHAQGVDQCVFQVLEMGQDGRSDDIFRVLNFVRHQDFGYALVQVAKAGSVAFQGCFQ